MTISNFSYKKEIKILRDNSVFKLKSTKKKPKIPKTLGKSQYTMKLFNREFRRCHICEFFSDNFVIKKRKAVCKLCQLQTNEEKLIWYLDDNGTTPSLTSEFLRIKNSTGLEKDEIIAFFNKKAQEENPGPKEKIIPKEAEPQKSTETEVIESEEEEEDDIPELD